MSKQLSLIKQVQGSGQQGFNDNLDIGILSAGDYMIHVYLQAGKNFRPEDNEETTGFLLQKFTNKEEKDQSVFDPMIKIECGEDSKHSTCKHKSLINDDNAIHWGEHFFFEPKALTQDEVQSQKIVIKVLDKGWFKDKLVGEFEFDVAQIYFMNEEHAIQHQWIALVNPQAVKNSQIKGYLRVSVAIQGPGDSSVKLSDPISSADQDEDPEILMPPQIRKQYKQIDLIFLQGQKFPKMDAVGWVEPVIEINDGLLISPKPYKYSTERESCEFNQIFRIPLAWPSSNDKLKIKIKDKDFTGHDVLGSIILSYKDIVQNCTGEGQLVWKNIYGAPLGLVEGPVKRLMNNNPNMATTWKGRVLMNIEVKDTKSPQQGVFDYTDPTIPLQEYRQAIKMKKYELMVEIGQGICLPQTKKYKVRIAIADFHVETDSPVQIKKNYCRWSQRFELTNQQILFPYESIEEMDQVYFYLMEEDKPICYWKGRIKDFTNRNPKFQWYPLHIDKDFGRVKHGHQAGLIQIKLAINDLEKEVPVNWKQYSAWKDAPPKRLNPCKIRCYIYQCRGLPSGDSDGTSDPFVQVHGMIEQNADMQTFRTQAVQDNINPIFYEAVDINYAYQDKESPPPIVMDIYDSDAGEGLIPGMMDGSDDFLARAIINLKDASVADYRKNEDDKYLSTPPKPRWHKLRAGNFPNLPECGEILCSFSLVPMDYLFKVPIDQITYVSKNKINEYQVDINCLGLRNLQSFGMLPVRKAFVRFNLRSMVPRHKSMALKNLRTEPKESGSSPNLNTCIQFSADLPTDPLYCPSLACDVFDQICKGLSQPKIGSFSIPIGEIMYEEVQNRIKMMECAQNIFVALNQAFQNAQEQKRSSMGRGTQQVSARKAEHALKKLQNNYALAFGLEEIEEEFGQGRADAENLEGQIDSTNEKQKLAMEMLQRERERKQSLMQPLEDQAAPRSAVRQIPSDSQMQGSLLMNDTVRNQTETIARDGAYESTVIIKESDYGDEESHSLIERQTQQSQREQLRSSTKISAGRLQKLMSEDDHDALLLGLIQHSQTASMPKDKAHDEQMQIKVLFQKIKNRDLQAVGQFHASLAELRRRRSEMALKGAQGDLQHHDSSNRMKMLNQVEQSLLTHVQNGMVDIKLQKRQTLLKEKKDDMIKMMQDGKDVHSNIIMPVYEKDERLKIYREKNKPPSSIYYEVGYDGPITTSEPKVRNKHYRKFYIDELENNKQIFFRHPFITSEIKRGQSRGLQKGLLDLLLGFNTDESGFKSNEQIVGNFKGHVHVYNQKSDEEYETSKAKVMKKIQEQISAISELKNERPFPFDIFNLSTAEERDKMKQELINMDIYSEDLDRFLMDQKYLKMLTYQLQNPQDCVVRLYMLEGFDFASRDIGSFSDPYLKIRQGKQVISKRDDYQLDEPNPKFHQVFEFKVKFPGTAPLEIEAWDYDDLFGDDLIGKSLLDLDDRFFSPEWRAIENKPIEQRELYHPSTSLAQGTVLCWLDISQQSKSKHGGGDLQQRVWDIKPEPKKDYQLRLSIFGTQNVPMEDLEGTSDVFVKAWINEKDKKETDTHWRCTNGEASFNYRLLFDFQSPNYHRSDRESYKLKIQIFDRDVFKSNDFICQFQLDLYLLVLDCRATQKQIHLNKKYYESYFKREYNKEMERTFVPGPGGPHHVPELLDLKFEDDDSFWLSIRHKNNAEPVRIRIDVRLVPGEDAKSQKVGDARSEPNHSPFLPAPIGRMKFTMNPFGMIGQLLGPGIKGMILKYFLMVVCVVLLVFLVPLVASNLATETLLGFLGSVWSGIKSIF